MEENTKNQIYVIGHKNPDTDSICSAIAYAYLKNQTDDGEFIPKRAGSISTETQYVLDRFQVKTPEYVPNVKTKVSDMEIRHTEGVKKSISLKKAWTILNETKGTTLPIVTDDNMLEGLISIGDIARSYMAVIDSAILSKAHTQYKNILETLDGTLYVGDEEAYFEKGKVVVAASSPEVMESYIEPDDMVILGNRYETQLCAIEMNAGCIILCGDAKVTKTIQILGREKNCTIIATPYDTYTVAHLINQSMPISYFMKAEDLILFHEDDFTDDIKDIMASKRHRDFPILNGKEQDLSGQRDGVKKLGELTPEDQVYVRFYPGEDEAFRGETVALAVERTDVLETYAKMVQAQKVDVRMKKEQDIVMQCTNDAKEDRYLMLSIPYDTGWHVSVDGEQTEIIENDHQMLIIPVKPGKHSIEIRYIPGGLYMGIFISVIALGMMIWKIKKSS